MISICIDEYTYALIVITIIFRGKFSRSPRKIRESKERYALIDHQEVQVLGTEPTPSASLESVAKVRLG